MPGLITVVLCMRLPYQDQAVSGHIVLHAKAKRIMDSHGVSGNLEPLQKRLELVAARRSLHRWIGHAKRFVMHMRRGPQPLDQGHLWPLVQLADKIANIRLGSLSLSHA